MRKIELYIGYTDNTWSTVEVEIPADTPEEDIEEIAIEQLDTNLAQAAAFIGLYHYDNADADDQWDDVFDDDFIGDQDPYGGYQDEARDDYP